MENIIKLKSRGKINNYLKKLSKPNGEESKTYLLVSEYLNVRAGIDGKGYSFIDPPGGPMIRKGERLEEVDMIVENITPVTGKGFAITFK